MWQKKEKNNLENISIEEYLVRRKNIRKEDSDRQSVILPENQKLFFTELYL